MGCSLFLAEILYIVALSTAVAVPFVHVDLMLVVGAVSFLAAVACGIALQIHHSSQDDDIERNPIPGQHRGSRDELQSESTLSPKPDSNFDSVINNI